MWKHAQCTHTQCLTEAEITAQHSTTQDSSLISFQCEETHTHRKGGGVRYKKYPENRKIQNSMTAMRAQEGMEVKRISDVELTELKKRKGRENQSYKRSYSERTDAAPVCVFHCALGVIVCNERTSNHLRQLNALCWIHACLSNHSANRFINQTTFDCTGHSIRFIYTI